MVIILNHFWPFVESRFVYSRECSNIKTVRRLLACALKNERRWKVRVLNLSRQHSGRWTERFTWTFTEKQSVLYDIVYNIVYILRTNEQLYFISPVSLIPATFSLHYIFRLNSILELFNSESVSFHIPNTILSKILFFANFINLLFRYHINRY